MTQPPPARAAPGDPGADAADEEAIRRIGLVVARMAERTRDEPAYLPHPVAVAMAEAVRGGNLTDGDGRFSAAEGPYQVVVAKTAGHFALLDVVVRSTGRRLPPRVVLRILQAHDRLASEPGDTVDGAVAEALVGRLLGVDDGSSALLLRRGGLGRGAVAKGDLLALLERLPDAL